MSFFDDVTLSWAGLVVLAFLALSISHGELVFGKRIWAKVTLAALVTIGAIAHFKEDDFKQGITTVVASKTKEAQKQMEPMFAAIVRMFAPPPPAP